MWDQSSASLRSASVFLSIVLLFFSSLASLRLMVISGLDKSTLLIRSRKVAKRFEPQPILKLVHKAVQFMAAVAVPFLLAALALERPYALPMTTAGFLILVGTIFWKFRSEVSLDLGSRFDRELQCLLILSLLSCSTLFIDWISYLQFLMNYGFHFVFVTSTLISGSIIIALFKILNLSTFFTSQKVDPQSKAFRRTYWRFEKRLALSMSVFSIAFSDLPILLFSDIETNRLLLTLWAMGFYFFTFIFVRTYTIQRTEAMIETGEVSYVDVGNRVAELAKCSLFQLWPD